MFLLVFPPLRLFLLFYTQFANFYFCCCLKEIPFFSTLICSPGNNRDDHHCISRLYSILHFYHRYNHHNSTSTDKVDTATSSLLPAGSLSLSFSHFSFIFSFQLQIQPSALVEKRRLHFVILPSHSSTHCTHYGLPYPTTAASLSSSPGGSLTTFFHRYRWWSMVGIVWMISSTIVVLQSVHILKNSSGKKFCYSESLGKNVNWYSNRTYDHKSR